MHIYLYIYIYMQARYFNGSIAVSLDAGRVTAMYRNGDVAVTSDENGNAMVCLPSGLVVYNHAQGTGGRLQVGHRALSYECMRP
jgi:hypothetical protein